MSFNYRRNILPNPIFISPREVRNLALPKYTVYVVSRMDMDINTLQMCAGKHRLRGTGFVYIKRIHSMKIV